MPYLKINTNTPLAQERETALAAAASTLVAQILSKPESYVLIEINSGVTMLFAGSNDPLAYMELKSIGLPENKTAEFSNKLCQLVAAQLNINTDRIYIEFAAAERHMWGWDKGTF
jgi:phenylpyruvate tautomerase PptA (4-oxalocrotonate tautomerase family)